MYVYICLFDTAWSARNQEANQEAEKGEEEQTEEGARYQEGQGWHGRQEGKILKKISILGVVM